MVQECLVMAKPGGPRCNLRCAYCYYLDKEKIFLPGPHRMPEELLEKFIIQRFEASPGPNTHFEWHGGEPTLLGLEYFRTIAQLQRKHVPPGQTVSNGLQTNGLLIDDEWAAFLASEGFSVGLSLDGPIDLHDCFRKTAGGVPTHTGVVGAFHLLKKHRVFCNALCVLHSVNATAPDRVYDFFRDIGATYLQFLPLVNAAAASAAPLDIGAFLCRIFDRWINEDVGRVVVQIFDEALRPIYGVPHALCVHRETCGDVAVLEHDGSVYACDHFVDTEHVLGNINREKLFDLTSGHAMAGFGNAKRDKLPRVCRECEALSFCNGGCPKDRTTKAPDGESGLNYLCSAYKMFFHHSRPELTRLAAHMKAGKKLREFKPMTS
jgi:uncharacterized protein